MSLSIFSLKENEGITANLVYAVVAQGVGLLSSLLMSLVVPKVLGLNDYAYWQLFLLYSSYSGLALFGFNDGIYLRLGGKRFSELDLNELKGQLVLVTAAQLILGVVLLSALGFLTPDKNRLFVYLAVVISSVFANITICFAYVFQSTNLTQISSISTMSSKAAFLLCVISALIFGSASFKPFVIMYVSCQAFSMVYCIVCARSILFAKACLGINAIRTCLLDIAAGMKIMIAYYADLFIVGFTRMLTDWAMGISAFGVISFSFSLTNFVLGFIGQVAMVVFPVLKRLDSSSRGKKYRELNELLLIVLPFVYLGYVPLKVLLGMWLPEYERSLIYLALTLPLCVYSSKANFLFNTYCKMEREEGYLCGVNVLTMMFNSVIAFISIMVFKSVELSAIGIVISVALRSLLFEIHFGKKFEISFLRGYVSELAIVLLFMSSSFVLGNFSFALIALAFGFYLLINRETFLRVLEMAKKKQMIDK